MANEINTVIYTGITGKLDFRIYQHKKKLIKGFTSKYNINKLVYYEEFKYIRDALIREKQIKAGPRKKKVELIERDNLLWKDLSAEWNG